MGDLKEDLFKGLEQHLEMKTMRTGKLIPQSTCMETNPGRVDRHARPFRGSPLESFGHGT